MNIRQFSNLYLPTIWDQFSKSLAASWLIPNAQVCDEGNLRFTVESCTDPSGRRKSDLMNLLLYTAHSNLGSQIVLRSVRPRLRVAGRKVQCTLSPICGENASSTPTVYCKGAPEF